ncbi:MAG: metal ABC transporter permease [Deltaproteobacteria bacterium]|nr:metal ABC transporter permease [Deltaproteobacteria bacterium]
MSWTYAWWIDFSRAVGLPEAFQYDFVARGVVAILMLAPLLGGLSHLVVARRLAFFSTTLGQAALTGLTIGVAVGVPLEDTYVSILGFCLLVGVVMAFIRRHSRLPADTVIGVFMAFTLGLGICVLVAATRSFNVHQIEAVMFGSLLTITDRDLVLLLVLGTLVGAAVAWAYNTILADSLSPPIAAARGAPTTMIEYGFVVIVTVAITVSLKVIGALLVEAMVVVPAAAARNLARSTRGYLVWSIAIAALAGLGGLFISTAWRVPTGGAIVLALSVCFFVTLPVGRLLR